jgi:plasmid stabilization system protein ParE
MRVRLLAAARTDIDAAAGWYEAASAGLGEAFRSEIDAVLARLSARPNVAPVWLPDRRFRCAHLKRFPYSLFLRQHAREWIVVAVTTSADGPEHGGGAADLDVLPCTAEVMT